MERTIVYIDGFNLYYGILSAKLHRYKWLNVETFAQSLLRPDQNLVEVKYLTSRVRKNPQKEKRQRTYLDALKAHTSVTIYYGRYQSNTIRCNSCGHVRLSASEKMTDVNIATEILIDAFHDKFDMALLISGDTDLIPPIDALHTNFPNKRVFVAFPPERHNVKMQGTAKGSMMIGRSKFVKHQLPKTITMENGYQLTKPDDW